MPTRPKLHAEKHSDAALAAVERALGPDETGAASRTEEPVASPTTGTRAESAPAPLTRHRRPLFALTGLRFFAAMYVVAYHTRLPGALLETGHAHLGQFFANGQLAVPLFFLLSGFILAYTYRGQLHTQGSSLRFWEARFARLWPAYVFSLLFSSLSPGATPRWPLALATLAMVQAWNPWHPEFAGTWNFVCWTLSVEAFFYLLFPWLQRGWERLRLVGTALLGASILGFGILCNVSARTLGSPQYPRPWDHIPLPVIHLPEFLIGVALGNLFVMSAGHEERSEMQKQRWPIITLCGAVLSLVGLSTFHGALTSVILIAFALLISGLALESSLLARFLSTPALLLGGAISYSIYLLHTPVRTVLYGRIALKLGLPGLAFVPVTLIPVAYLTYRFLEEPSRLVLRRFFANAQHRRGRAA